MHVAVIGAGIAGLTCAWRLQQQGHSVALFEREVTAGGRMRSESHGEFIVDRGAGLRGVRAEEEEEEWRRQISCRVRR